MKRTLIACMVGLAALALSGCDIERETVEKTQQQGSWKVEKLFTVDGCSVYRFYDSRWIYYSNCAGHAQYEYTTNTGKVSTTHQVEATTSVQH